MRSRALRCPAAGNRGLSPKVLPPTHQPRSRALPPSPHLATFRSISRVAKGGRLEYGVERGNEHRFACVPGNFQSCLKGKLRESSTHRRIMLASRRNLASLCVQGTRAAAIGAMQSRNISIRGADNSRWGRTRENWDSVLDRFAKVLSERLMAVGSARGHVLPAGRRGRLNCRSLCDVIAGLQQRRRCLPVCVLSHEERMPGTNKCRRGRGGVPASATPHPIPHVF